MMSELRCADDLRLMPIAARLLEMFDSLSALIEPPYRDQVLSSVVCALITRIL